MAPSKKKQVKTSPKFNAPAPGAAGTITGPDIDSPNQPPALGGASSTGRPRKQALVPAPPIPAMVRPKRNAEKKFYDDIEDERPQHLTNRNKKKKDARESEDHTSNSEDSNSVGGDGPREDTQQQQQQPPPHPPHPQLPQHQQQQQQQQQQRGDGSRRPSKKISPTNSAGGKRKNVGGAFSSSGGDKKGGGSSTSKAGGEAASSTKGVGGGSGSANAAGAAPRPKQSKYAVKPRYEVDMSGHRLDDEHQSSGDRKDNGIAQGAAGRSRGGGAGGAGAGGAGGNRNDSAPRKQRKTAAAATSAWREKLLGKEDEDVDEYEREDGSDVDNDQDENVNVRGGRRGGGGGRGRSRGEGSGHERVRGGNRHGNGDGERGDEGETGAGKGVGDASNDVWVQCDTCKKWRRLPDYVDADALPAKWYCEMNQYDESRANCRAKQEPTTGPRLTTPKPKGPVNEEEERIKDANLRAYLRGWARRLRVAEKAEAWFAPSMSTRGKRKTAGEVQWIQCQNCGKWRSMLRSMDPSIFVGPGLQFYCLMNTWDEPMASCSAPQENQFIVEDLFPSPPASPSKDNNGKDNNKNNNEDDDDVEDEDEDEDEEKISDNDRHNDDDDDDDDEDDGLVAPRRADTEMAVSPNAGRNKAGTKRNRDGMPAEYPGRSASSPVALECEEDGGGEVEVDGTGISPRVGGGGGGAGRWEGRGGGRGGGGWNPYRREYRF